MQWFQTIFLVLDLKKTQSKRIQFDKTKINQATVLGLSQKLKNTEIPSFSAHSAIFLKQDINAELKINSFRWITKKIN